MSTLFDRCITLILKNEGGYGNHPADPGGETIYGIADSSDGKKDGLIDIDRDGRPDVKVKDLTPDQAKKIYLEQYWKPMNLDGIKNENLVLQVFDFGVNAGIRTSIKLLQGIVGAEMDGCIGPKTCKMVNDYHGDLISEFIKQRRSYYSKLTKVKPEKLVFLTGWLNRADNTVFKS